MQASERYFSGDVITFDGKLHKVTAWKVSGIWRVSAIADGHVVRGKGSRSLERAIRYFQERYQERAPS